VLEELVEQRAAETAGSDDEDLPDADAVAPRFLEVATDRRPAPKTKSTSRPRKRIRTRRE